MRQLGIELLSELVLLIRERPEISTGALLEHFAERDEAGPLQKLAALELPGEDAALRTEFMDAIAQLDKQVLQQRVEELQQLQRDGLLSDADKQEMREVPHAALGGGWRDLWRRRGRPVALSCGFQPLREHRHAASHRHVRRAAHRGG